MKTADQQEQELRNNITSTICHWLIGQEKVAGTYTYTMAPQLENEARAMMERLYTDYCNKRGAGPMWLKRMLWDASQYSVKQCQGKRPALFQYMDL